MLFSLGTNTMTKFELFSCAAGRTGLNPRLRKEVMQLKGAEELCDHIVQAVLRSLKEDVSGNSVESPGNGDSSQGTLDTGEGHAMEKKNSDCLDEENTCSQARILRVGVGCDVGRHRSVSLVEEATSRLKKLGINVQKPLHRDIMKNKAARSCDKKRHRKDKVRYR
uniref:RapZ C-terminal domain-containing protein n=1 Tax=Lotharella oceanica TaxID=641309 RepID=A0A7S2TKL2_9EUKA|mmetsp:Transcript_18633/g.35171  ORF Transcript_18633/g.35171 Transcript_18633/m.35171 type:complete len:166 (+) Transcript_18633:172-669(+)